jgi:hypothetical protein
MAERLRGTEGGEMRPPEGARVPPSVVVKRVGTIALMAWVAIELHELGHLLAYSVAGYPARMSFQRVDPTVAVPGPVRLWAELAGPVASLVAAAVLLAIALRRPGFAWITAAFASASIRLLPCAMDLVRAVRGARPFSDEGEVAMALTTSRPGRAGLVLLALLPGLWLTARTAREYRFRGHAAVKAVLVYALTLSVGIFAILLDDLLGARGS